MVAPVRTLVSSEYTLFEHFSEGVQVLDENLRYMYLNDNAVAHSGRDRADLIGHRMVDVYPGIEHTWVYKAVASSLAAGKSVRTTNDFAYPDGTTRFFQLRIEPTPHGLVIFSYDISQEQARIIHLESVALAAQNHEHTTFALSKALRTPQRLALGNLQLLADSPTLTKDSEDQACVQDALESVEELGALLDALSTHAMLGQDTPMETVEIAQLVQDVCDELGEYLEESDATVTIRDLPTLEVYPEAFRFLLSCLVRNALEARNKQTRPYIEISAIRTSPCWEFVLQDNGSGIPSEHLPRVFQMFYKVPGESSEHPVGAGLAHCHKIVQLHGGSIWFESSTAAGSTVRFSVCTCIRRSPQPNAAAQELLL